MPIGFRPIFEVFNKGTGRSYWQVNPSVFSHITAPQACHLVLYPKPELYVLWLILGADSLRSLLAKG